ncbi:ribosome biogenesis GTP-binding protein YihA/YsxC [Hippea maritima]|uniref:Probable GTP-binding protein EngB n=1 Tax=Hippea maritima (strain ATCC 700847 / DSM 10411 / MH2) TaxID=760142 RepID=F2LU27_HIPMA|nr:ribosome biogenesis GTP-binding protein YihA/YsxC [Hippea maritima]AEA33426.1 GTP-binding protein engB [Hippea maritima DSM 10411]
MPNQEKNNGDFRHCEKHGEANGCLSFKKAIFEGSYEDARLLGLPQIAFAGRSNVGKSSLINAILSRKIAYVSKNPGKTVMINAIKVNDRFYFIDLPGYGYARRSKQMRNKWRKTIEDYLKNSNLLYHVFVLVDSRHLPMDNDIMFLDWLRFYKKTFSVVFTKTDKSTQKDISANISYLKKQIGNFSYFLTSSKKKRDIDKLCDFIAERVEEFP